MSLEDILVKYRRNSKGYDGDPVAFVFPRILLGPGCYLNPIFINVYNITHIINCAEDSACPQWAKRWVGKNYKCMNAIDHPDYPILENHFSQFESAMDTFLRDLNCKNIYIHCQAGMNRSACLILAYVTKRFRVDLFKLIEKVVKQRPCILTNPGFQKQLLEFK
jgi:Dual specificity phosphatase, catalytic domain